ncbi:3684_t:CDS:2 [Funneliformis caledonium]|uniref:3684_t:CDS:1 n=1 Tax=Funneliformis caledonium TaxID=1117310 RepID=A0A9N9E113_9GLOM|nr:3684_t:CDS:2 [Funneliformis caledonium]
MSYERIYKELNYAKEEYKKAVEKLEREYRRFRRGERRIGKGEGEAGEERGRLKEAGGGVGKVMNKLLVKHKSEELESEGVDKQLDNDDLAFLNCHPPKNHDIPITLYHEFFGEFLKDCKDFNIKNEDKNTRFVNYDTTSYKFNSNGQEIDGVWRKKYNGKTTLLTIFEFKNEFSVADSYMQASAYYSKYFEELYIKKSHILQHTCIPTFLVYIYGPYFGIAGAVMGQSITIDPLIEGSLILRHGNESWINQITKVFCALRKANDNLDKYYEEIVKSGENLQMERKMKEQVRYPFLKKYKSTSEEFVNIEYIDRIDSENKKLIFLVKESGVKRILKFTTLYNADVHKFCFNQGFASELVKIDNVENTDFRFVIMEYLDGFNVISDIWHKLKEKEKIELKKKILDVVKIMHDNNFVHGDLNFENIMAKLNSDGNWIVKFIDFDWTGYNREAEYPQFLNKKIPWYNDVQQLGKIFYDHDNHLISYYFNRYR